jgi:F0F1-type ATP synthase epsilon subunit
MYFFLSSASNYTYTQSNTTKIIVNLRNGSAEILNNHDDLMGVLFNDIVKIETTFENKVEKLSFLVQDALVVVSTKGIHKDAQSTSIYIYSEEARQLTPKMSLTEVSKEIEEATQKLEVEMALKQSGTLTSNFSIFSVNFRIRRLEGTIKFLKKLLVIVRDQKK